MAENEKNMDLCELKCTLIDALKTQMSGGVGNVDAEEAGEVVDMIKDFAQTDYYEAKAHYYRTVEKAMEAEEWVCNFIADYGMRIFSIAYEVMGEDAWMFIPYELDRLIA